MWIIHGFTQTDDWHWIAFDPFLCRMLSKQQFMIVLPFFDTRRYEGISMHTSEQINCICWWHRFTLIKAQWFTNTTLNYACMCISQPLSKWIYTQSYRELYNTYFVTSKANQLEIVLSVDMIYFSTVMQMFRINCHENMIAYSTTHSYSPNPK